MRKLPLKKKAITGNEDFDTEAFLPTEFGGFDSVVIRPGKNQDRQFPQPSYGQLLPLTVPGQSIRITEGEFANAAASPRTYTEPLVGTPTSKDTHLLWLVQNIKSNPIYDFTGQSADTADTRIFDFCNISAAQAAIPDDGQLEPCAIAVDSLYVEWDYRSSIDAQGKKKPLFEALSSVFGESKIKMAATVAPNHTVIWLPILGGNHSDIVQVINRKKSVPVYGVTYLDGPNIFIARLDRKPWFHYQP